MPFPDLSARLAEVRTRIEAAVGRGGHGQTVTVVGVTKTYGPEAPLAAWAAGLRDVGARKAAASGRWDLAIARSHRAQVVVLGIVARYIGRRIGGAGTL